MSSNEKPVGFTRKNGTQIISTIGLNYFTYRDKSFISGDVWLEGKRKDDNIEGYWRIHNRLYDFQSFIKKHPGGSEWLKMTKGTDITEAFETHHIKGVAENLLSRYYVKEITTKRKSPFTFSDNGFYKTLKRRISDELPNIPKDVIDRSKTFSDLVMGFYILFCIFTISSGSYYLGILTGYLLTLTVNINHNFVHQRDNFRMYYLDLSMISSREFRIVHALSHHLFPNSIHDLEITMYEPLLYFLPENKTFFKKYFSWLYVILYFPLLSITGYILRIFKDRTLRINPFIPWIPFILAYTITGQDFFTSLKMFILIILWSSLFFHLIAKTASHHHPEVFHDGDTARPADEMDFGIYQLDAVSDRPNLQGHPFLVLSNFGDHALHHLFPTLDQAILDYLYPIFLKTCIEFRVEWKLYSSVELVQAALLQLARDKPNEKQPPTLKKIDDF